VTHLLIELVVDAVTLGALYLLIALGYVLVYSVLRIFHLAHGDVAVTGGMVGILVLKTLHVGTPNTIPIVLAITLAIMTSAAFSALLSLAIEVFVYRRIRSQSALTPLLAALGLSLVIQNLLLLATSKDPISFPTAAVPQGFIELGGVRLLYVSIVIIAAAATLLVCVAGLVRGTRLGIAMLAIAQDADAARMVGIPVPKIVAGGFLVSGALAGAAGFLFAMYIGSLAWFMGSGFSIRGFSAALIGGLSSILGAGVGAIVLGVGEIFGVGLRIGNIQLDPSWRDAIAFILVILVLLFRPEGLLGGRNATWRVRN
jgi:branched-chain amino acid transport system permease protein